MRAKEGERGRERARGREGERGGASSWLTKYVVGPPVGSFFSLHGFARLCFQHFWVAICKLEQFSTKLCLSDRFSLSEIRSSPCQFPCPLSLAFFFSPSSEPRSICLCLPVSRPISLLHTFVGRQDQVRVMAGIMLTLSSAKTAVRSSETSRPTCALTRSASHFLRLAPSSATESSAS